MTVHHSNRRGNVVLITLTVCLALVFGCLALGYLLLASKSAPAPQPQASAAPAVVAPTPEVTKFDPLPVAQARVGKGISNGAKAELLGSWEGSKPPLWVPESEGRVKLTLPRGEQSLEFVWRIENGQAVPDNKLTEQLESWVPDRQGTAPAFLANQPEAGPAPSAPPPAASAPRPTATADTPSANDTAWRDDGDPNRITNADLPPAAFAPKKPKPGKSPRQKPGTGTDPELGSAGNLKLMGVMETEGGKKAMLSQGGEPITVRVGENVGNYTVESIEGREVVLGKNGQRVRLQAGGPVGGNGGRPSKPTRPEPPPRPEPPSSAPGLTPGNPDLEVPPIEEPVFDPGPFDESR